MGRRRSAARKAMWQERFTRFHTSGLTAVRFCREEGVSTAAFYRWRNRLEANRAKPNAGGTPPKSQPPKGLPKNQARKNTPTDRPTTMSPTNRARKDSPTKPSQGMAPTKQVQNNSPTKQTRKPSTAPSFRPVRVTPGGGPMTIRLAGGARIDVPVEHLDAVRVVLDELLRYDSYSPAGDARC